LTLEKCDFCGDEGRLGGEIRAFRFRTPKGGEVIRYLHPTGGDRRCFHLYEAKYTKWMEQQKARVSNG
jgi:hypothetical protein